MSLKAQEAFDYAGYSQHAVGMNVSVAESIGGLVTVNVSPPVTDEGYDNLSYVVRIPRLGRSRMEGRSNRNRYG